MQTNRLFELDISDSVRWCVCMHSIVLLYLSKLNLCFSEQRKNRWRVFFLLKDLTSPAIISRTIKSTFNIDGWTTKEYA